MYKGVRFQAGIICALLVLGLSNPLWSQMSITDAFVVGIANSDPTRDPVIARVSDNGDVLWEKTIPLELMGMSQSRADRNISEDAFYIIPDGVENIVEGQCQLFKYNADGSLAWQKGLSARTLEISANPVDGGIYVAQIDSGIYRLDGAGNILWGPVNVGINPSTLNVWVIACDATDGGIFAAERTTGKVYKLDKAGNLLWSCYTDFPVKLNACNLDGGVYVGSGSYAKNTYKLDHQGNVVWVKYNFPSAYTYPRAVNPVDGALYISSGWPARFIKVAMDGSIIWDVDNIISSGDDRSNSAIAVSLDGNYLYTGLQAEDHGIKKFSDVDCSQIWHKLRDCFVYTGDPYDPQFYVFTGMPSAAQLPVNQAPIADAGPDMVLHSLAVPVQITGGQSWDPDGDVISYSWVLMQKPVGSSAELEDVTSAVPTLVPDVYGEYVCGLTVADDWTTSASDQVVLSFLNIVPVADAGPNLGCLAGQTVILDGSGSSDENGDALSYLWLVVSKPENSTVAPVTPHAAVTELTPDLPGEYIISLVVNDGTAVSEPSFLTVTVTARNDVVVQELHDLLEYIAAVPVTVYKNRNMGKTLTNKICSILLKVDQNEYQDALNQLENGILGKIDGCREQGAPDKNDWILDCSVQADICAAVESVTLLLQDLLSGYPKRAADPSVEMKEFSGQDMVRCLSGNGTDGPYSFEYTIPAGTEMTGRGVNVNVSITDAKGMMVAQIFSGQQMPGRYHVVWNGVSGNSREDMPGMLYCSSDVNGKKYLCAFIRVK